MVQAPEQPATLPQQITMKSLLEAGVHFGHQTRRWNPSMRRYIFTHRNGIHIIDLQQTLGLLETAAKAITRIIVESGEVLFVGTKKQAQEAVHAEATRCGMPYVNQRWLGGTLTNFQTISSRVAFMKELEEKKEKGYQSLTKKEALKLDEELARLHKYFLGIRDMKTLPDALFVLDIEKEDICIAEARRMGIPVVALVDSNVDPDLVTYPIPGNDDAIRSIRLMASRMADAVLEGLREREALLAEKEAEEDVVEEEVSAVAVDGIFDEEPHDDLDQKEPVAEAVLAEEEATVVPEKDESVDEEENVVEPVAAEALFDYEEDEEEEEDR